MKSKNSWDDFIDYFTNKSELIKCPFLANWYLIKLKEYNQIPEKPSREGIPKGSPMPIPRNKLLLSLYRTIYPVSLKKFAQAFNASYGVIKVWNSSEDNEQRIDELSLEFVKLFIDKFCDIVEKYDLYPESPESIPIDDYGLYANHKITLDNPEGFLENPPILRLLSELKHYNRYVPKTGATGVIPLLLVITMEKVMATKAKSFKYRYAYKLFRNAIRQTKSERLKLKDFIEHEKDWQKRELIVCKFYFRELIKEAEKGNKEDVIEIAKYLEDYFIDNIMPNFFELLMDKRIKQFNKSA